MLADAIRAETFRLSRNRMTLAWSVVFVPVLAVVFAAIGHLVLNAKADEIAAGAGLPPQMQAALAGGPLDIAAAMAETAGDLANPALLLFVLIGATALFAGDYRWETWRLISARNSRSNLLLSKVAVFSGLALLAMAALFIGGMVEELIKAAVFDRPLTFEPTADTTRHTLAFWSLGWWRVVQFGLLSLLAAVATRSLLAALFVPLAVGVGQALTPQILIPLGVEPSSWTMMMVNPGLAYDMLKNWVVGMPGMMPAGEGVPLKASASLAFWTALPLAMALAMFQHQDLSKE